MAYRYHRTMESKDETQEGQRPEQPDSATHEALADMTRIIEQIERRLQAVENRYGGALHDDRQEAQ